MLTRLKFTKQCKRQINRSQHWLKLY